MEAIRPPSYAAANRDIIRVMFKPSFLYLAGLGVSVALVGLLAFCLLHEIWWGMGMAGTNNASFWGTYIVTFVFWVGIGHAGTLISAILFLLRQAMGRTAGMLDVQ